MFAALAAVDVDGEIALALSNGPTCEPIGVDCRWELINDVHEINTQTFHDNLDKEFAYHCVFPLHLLYAIVPDESVKDIALDFDWLPTVCVCRSDALLGAVHCLNDTVYREGILLDFNYYGISLWFYQHYHIRRISKPCQFSTQELIAQFLREGQGVLGYLTGNDEDTVDPRGEALRALQNPQAVAEHYNCPRTVPFVEAFCKRQGTQVNQQIVKAFGDKLENAEQLCLFGSGSRILSKWLLQGLNVSPVIETCEERFLCEAIVSGRPNR